MYSYIIGEVIEVDINGIVIENNGIGYFVYCANPYSFKTDGITKVYLYQHIREDEISLYGFKEKSSREIFLKLISVKGLGCKIALPMLATGTADNIITAIENEDITYLKKFPKIGDKVARQIILDLKGKLVSKEDNSGMNTELIETLKALGYKTVSINKIIKDIDSKKTLEEQIKEALKLLLK